jgi:predicted oxidoreductase
MQTQTLGGSGLSVTRLAYGCMPLGGSWDGKPLNAEAGKAAFASLDTALEAGLTFFDHADIYCRGKSEQVFGEWLKAHRGLRAKIHIQSKCGIRFPDVPPGAPLRYDFSRAYIVSSAEGCLKRLGIEYLDVLLLHRPDALVEPEEVARAFEELHAAGKVRHFGVSNHSAAQMELLRKSVTRPLVANQVEMNLIHTEMFDAGINWNLTGLSASSAGDWTLEYCRRENITLQAWAPLANGLLSGREPRADDPRLERIKAAGALVAKLADEKGVPREAIVLAWLLRHPARIQPLIGTRQPERIRAACQADGVELTREEWYALYQAGRGKKLP